MANNHIKNTQPTVERPFTSDYEMRQKALQATLSMADHWAASADTIHHGIKSYKEVIAAFPESDEAGEAREALLNIAANWNKQGRTYAAAR
jgi:hypothetical protein